MVSFVRVTVLLWADILAAWAVRVMVTYLTNVWNLNFTHAAAIVNLFTGAAAIMPIGMAFLVDAVMGDYCMLLLSSLAYSFGMGFLWLSTPPVLSNAAGKCCVHRPDCICDTQRVLFYTSLALIAVGISGHMTSLESFLNRQLQSPSDKKPRQFAGYFVVIFLPIVGGFALPYIKPWSVRFGIPAICTVLATLLFMSGSCSYEHDRPKGSPLTTVLRVFIASASKMFHQLPKDANQLFENQSDLHHTNSLRCLDKAAIVVSSQTPIVVSSQTPDQKEQNRWKLCRVTEVEETKIYIRMIPMWITLTMCGVVTSIGGTYFLEQANHMNHKVGRLKVPLPVLLIFYDCAKSQFTKLYVNVTNKLIPIESRKYVPPIGIVVSMLFSILCCITAAKVESRRLDVITRHELLEKPNEKIPMNMFWLLPQFLLLGALDGISKHSIDSFFKDQVPPSMSRSSRYLIIFTYGVLGLGFMGGILSVYVVGKISERGGKPSWFQDTLNKSRLDNYYWTLAVLSCVNLVFYIFAAIWYSYQDSTTEDIEEPEHENYTRCCCCCCGGGY